LRREQERTRVNTFGKIGLVNCHLCLVAKIAKGYRGYGLPITEVISEGNVGLMQAIRRFEPERGFRPGAHAGVADQGCHSGCILRS
jgi:DNA-directed RNA polymerase sigma subunit (sigma70/sigma32)